MVTMEQHAKDCMARTRAKQKENRAKSQGYEKGWDEGYRAAAENAKDIERQGGTVSEDLLPYMGMKPVTGRANNG